MTRSYRLGIHIVLGAILVAAVLSLAWAVRSASAPRPAGLSVPPGIFPLGDFRLVDRSTRVITQDDFRGRVWVVSFIFTRCPLSCPRISTVMKNLTRRLSGSDVLLASITVDPDFDTPSVLTEYARRFDAPADRWFFLTASKPAIHELVQARFKLGLQEASPAEKAAGSEVITHSDRLALVEDGQVVGYFDSNDTNSLDALVARASRLALPRWIKALPTVNATLNGLCAVLLSVGWVLIRRRGTVVRSGTSIQDGPPRENRMLHDPAVLAHLVVMLTAVAVSALFLTTYLVYHSQAGSTPFPHQGPLRILYFTILLSHTSLAVAVVPLVATTLIRAWRGDYAKHAAIAQVTFPIWFYVSMTGVVIYLMLYHLPTQASAWQSIL